MKEYSQILLGVGIGLTLSGLIVLAGSQPKNSEEEIIANARQLGMVFRDEVVQFAEKPPTTDIDIDTKDIDGSQMERPGMDNKKDLIDAVTVNIPPGTPLSRVTEILKEAGVANSQQFLTVAKAQQLSNRILAGQYEVPIKANVDEIIDIITR